MEKAQANVKKNKQNSKSVFILTSSPCHQYHFINFKNYRKFHPYSNAGISDWFSIDVHRTFNRHH